MNIHYVKQFPRKVRILLNLIRGQFDFWRIEVLRRDLDELYCCTGRECGCFGATVGDVFGEKP